MAGGIKRVGNGTSRARGIKTGVDNNPNRQGLIKINQLQFPVVTAWENYTPSVDWTNTTALGKWRRVGDSIEIDVTLSFSGAPSGGTLHIGIPSGLTVDTNKLPATRHLLGNALIYDGTSYLQGAMEYDTANTFRILVIRESAAQTHNLFTVSPTSPATIGSGDLMHFHWITPIQGWDANGYGTIEEIIGSSILDAADIIKMGRTDNSEPVPGEIGEYKYAQPGANVTPAASGSQKTVISLPLPPGDWDVYGGIVFNPGTITGWTLLACGISLTTDTFSSVSGQNIFRISQSSGTGRIQVGPYRHLSQNTVTLYLVAEANYSTLGTANFGTDSIIWARRRS